MIPRFSPATTPWETVRFLAGLMNPLADDGMAVARFEEAFARWQGARYALFVPSGRMAFSPTCCVSGTCFTVTTIFKPISPSSVLRCRHAGTWGGCECYQRSSI